jgi:hypothetical protein
MEVEVEVISMRRGPSLPSEIAAFDSATAMLVALAGFLRGTDMPPLGRPGARLLAPAAAVATRLPVPARQAVYSIASGNEGQRPERLGDVDFEQVTARLISAYPQRRYPAVAVGSSSGALMHLCAALGIPWLPQTVLLPVRQRAIGVDRPSDAARALDAPARALLDRNRDIALHHMHDPNQDRLSLRRMAYFRVKKTALGPAYASFLRSSLEADGVILVANCRRRWPTTRIGDRHVFQFGAVGGMEAPEYHDGSHRVAAYLRRYADGLTRWDGPTPDGDSPEAEWGFDGALLRDLEEFARLHGFKVRVLTFDGPEDLSPLVADLYRWWYGRHGIAARRLLVESFMLLDPWRALQTGSIPYWSVFPVEPSIEKLIGYLDATPTFDEIDLALFCHGVESVGVASRGQLESVLGRARTTGRFAGVSPERFPSDLSSFFGFNAFLRSLPHAPATPPALTLDELNAFVRAAAARHPAVSLETR